MLFAFSQQKYSISGYIKDVETGETLIGATVYIKELQTGTAANVYGFYSLTVPEGSYTLVYTFIGFDEVTKQIELTEDIKINLEMQESSSTLDEVVISSEGDRPNVKNVEMSVSKLDIKTIEKIPALLGEVDVIRSIQLLPGVSTVGEGSSGFNVRGGAIDQNLILLDEAPVYNSSHLFGFFSVFNPDAVSNVKLIKGGIPSTYGGRLSSILDVRMKEGNSKKFAGEGGVGVIFSRLALEGPIIKNKASFIVAARRSYIDILAKPFLKGDLKDSKFYFYDLTAKVNATLNDNNRLFLSGYFGRDVFGADFGFNWGNSTVTLRWNHVFNKKLFFNATAFYSNYDYRLEVGDDTEGFNWKSRIINYSIKPEFTWYANPNNTVKFGGQSLLYNFVPGTASFSSGGVSNDISLPDKYALESSVYVSNEQKVGALITLQYGVRQSFYQYLGESVIYEFNDPEPGMRKMVTNIDSFEQWETINTYNNFEPRFSVKYQLNEVSSIKASYNRMAQYIHLISNTTASTPLDVWTPSTNNIKPQIADQVALGYFRNFGENDDYETSVETYHKWLQNQIDYIDGASLLLNPFLEGDLLNAKGRAYGVEFYVKKNTGKLNGWISYTLARTERKVDGINQGNWYANRFDKLHNFNIVGNYDFSKYVTFSASFVFSTGTPATFPTNRIELQGYIIPHNSEYKRNNYRIPPYHRLDLSVTLYRKKENPKNESNWVFSLYNTYGRRNPFSIYFQQNEDNPQVTEAVRYSILGTVVVAATYNFKF